MEHVTLEGTAPERLRRDIDRFLAMRFACIEGESQLDALGLLVDRLASHGALRLERPELRLGVASVEQSVREVCRGFYLMPRGEVLHPAAFAFGLAAMLAHLELERWVMYGAALGHIVGVRVGVQAGLLGVSPLTELERRCLPEKLLGGAEVLVGSLDQPPDREAARAWLSRRDQREAWLGLAQEHAGVAADLAGGHLAAEQLVGQLMEPVLGLSARATLRALVKPWTGSSLESDLAQAIAGGLEALGEGAPWEESWEVQRWGAPGCDEVLVGSLFPQAVILWALHRIGEPVEEAVRALFAALPPGPPRYFGDWQGIPPDSDDMGLMLLLGSTLEERPTVANEWLEAARASASPEGVVPTWLRRGAKGEGGASGVAWAGDRCGASAIRFVTGAMAWDPDGAQELAEPTLSAALAATQRSSVSADRSGCFFYSDQAVGPLLLDLQRVAPSLLPDQVRVRLFGLGGRLARAVLTGRELKPARLLDVAAALEAVMATEAAEPWSAPGLRPRLRATLRAIINLQRPDGTWPESPCFRTLSKKHRHAWHGGRMLSTALVLRALVAAKRALFEEAETSG